MNELLKNRIKLIRCIENAANKFNPEFSQYSLVKKFVDFIRKDEAEHFISFSFDDISKISYAANPKHKLDTDKRSKTTIRKYFRRNFCPETFNFHDEELDDLGKNILVELSKLNKDLIETRIKIIEGTAIEDFYEQTTCHSCMTGENNKAGSFLLLYSMNPDKVKLVVLDDYVRALLWTCDDGSQVLDRAYPANCDGIDLIREWAKSKGYILRCVPDKLVESSMSTELSDFDYKKITMKIVPDMNFPYLDTFKFGKFVGDKLILSNNNSFGDIIFTETDGGYSVNRICCMCGGSADEDFDYDGDYYCEKCFCEEYFYCEECEQIFHSSDKCSYNGDAYCSYCINKFSSCCCHCGEYEHNDAVIITAIGEEYCSYCASKYLTKCCDCEEYELNSNITIVDGNNICKDCLKDNYIVCENCNETVEDCHSTSFDGKTYCNDCSCEFSCEFCDKNKNLQKIGDIIVCEECASENHNVSYM